MNVKVVSRQDSVPWESEPKGLIARDEEKNNLTHVMGEVPCQRKGQSKKSLPELPCTNLLA